MNQIVLLGRMVEDPEIKESENGVKYSNITVAVPRSYKNADGMYETDFINCSIFGAIASSTCEYCRKGDMIAIKGRMESYSYEKEDGTKKYGQNVVAEKVTFLSSSKSKDVEQDNSDIEM
jgi:single-strand DNA-binding protein